jgi:energy-coupling factor transporter ATP-binding protein EcfA2
MDTGVIPIDRRLKEALRIERAAAYSERLKAVLAWKRAAPPSFPLIAILLGGTGTGKSTLFNSLCGAPISRVGVIRPLTMIPTAFTHRDFAERLGECPMMGGGIKGNQAERFGRLAEMRVHDRAEFKRLILVDTPDFDSVEETNRATADDFLILADIVIYVTSQEKYADEKGLDFLGKALRWGKKSLVVMNKVSSEDALSDFEALVETRGVSDVIRVGRVEGCPEFLPDLWKRPEFAELGRAAVGDVAAAGAVRERELARLEERTAQSVEELSAVVNGARQRIAGVQEAVRVATEAVASEMERRLNEVLSDEAQARVKERLREILAKYDPFSGFRRRIRETLIEAWRALSKMAPGFLGPSEEPNLREDMTHARLGANLEALEWAVSELNRRVADVLREDESLGDLLEIARMDAPRLNSSDIRHRFDELFPGVEHLLEEELERLRAGLSTTDELKLIGANALYALLIITVEIAVGGGFTMLDAVLGGVLGPFIPGWVLNAKVIETLRDIARRVDAKYRAILAQILEEQARRYIDAFEAVKPNPREPFRLKNVSA